MAIVYWEEKGTELTPLEVDENFHDLDERATQLRTDVDLKADATLMAQPEGIATLNNVSKVIQTALNSDKLDGKTFAQIAELFIAAVAKGAADGVAELDGTGKLKASQVPDSLVSGLTFRGAWDADSNTPEIPASGSGNEGYFYVVNVAGGTEIDGISTWELGDWIVSNGTVWARIPATAAPVNSVAGKTGDVLIEIADVDGLVSALAIKKEIGAENTNTELTDFNDIISADNFRLAEISAMTNKPDLDNGEAFLTVEKYGASIKQIITVFSNGNMYSRVFAGDWSAWRPLN